MRNAEIAAILSEIGVYLEMQNVAFKPRAYEKAAEAIGGLEDEIDNIYKNGGLKALEIIPGVGVSIAEKIEELIKTGKLKYYGDLKKKMPVKLSELLQVEGLGPKGIKKLYQRLKIKDLKTLEAAARLNKIGKLEGFGPKSEENILKSIGFVKNAYGRMPLGKALPLAKRLEERLKKARGVKKIDVAGSTRRWKETIGDLDILVASTKPDEVMDVFTKLPEVVRVYGKGRTKSSVRLKEGIDADLRVVPESSYGAALNYFTGSKDHNVALRIEALKKGLKLNEYGLFKRSRTKGGWVQIAGRSEEEVYRALGLQYVPPEMRENLGEIKLAQNNELPHIIGYGDLEGDLQTQTDWTDGSNSIEDLVKEARSSGLTYIAITDHTKRLAMAHGLDEKKLLKQIELIDKINAKLKKTGSGFRVLKGTECDILKDGSLDLDDKTLSRLDVVGISVHSYFNLKAKEQTERIKKAMSNKYAHILFHPTGRLINERPPYEVDMNELIRFAKKTKTVLEINGAPERLDLKDEYIRKCVEAGVKLAIDSDAHNIYQLHYLVYGLSQARRGWVKKSDVVNAWPVEKMLKMLK